MRLFSKAVKKHRASAETLADAVGRPGPRGWRGRGGGRVNRVRVVEEWEATSNQVCGLWPFPSGSGLPVAGIPLGHHLETAATVCGDPVSWFLANLISNPSAFVLGRPGLGKSSLIRHMCVIYPAWGINPVILSDSKGEHVDLIEAIGGEAIHLGRGIGSLNVLDLGVSAEELSGLDERAAQRVMADLRASRENVIVALMELVSGKPMTDAARNVVTTALAVVDDEVTGRPPVISDLEDVIDSAHDRVRQTVRDRGDMNRYRDRTEGVLDALVSIGARGQFGSVFAEPTTREMPTDRPVVFDVSSVEENDLTLLAALQISTWTYASSRLLVASEQAKAGIIPERTPVMVVDEMWRMFKAAEVMVLRVDALSRLNRQRGLGQIQCTHTMKDLKMSTEALTETAWGLVERAGMVFLGGLAPNEMGNLASAFSLSERESSTLIRWSQKGGHDPITGAAAAPPGRGQFLLKTGDDPGIPFRVELTDLELHLNDTNKRWHSLQAARSQQRRATAAGVA